MVQSCRLLLCSIALSASPSACMSAKSDKRHGALAGKLRSETVGYAGRRHVQRVIWIMLKATMRGAAESVNLCDHAADEEATSAELLVGSSFAMLG